MSLSIAVPTKVWIEREREIDRERWKMNVDL